MGRSKPRELREAILRARAKNLTYNEIAELVGVGRATVNRTLRLHRESGDIEPRPKGGGNLSLFHDKVAKLLLAIVETLPDASLEELTRAFEDQSHLSTSRAAVGRALQRFGYSRKKRPSAQ